MRSGSTWRFRGRALCSIVRRGEAAFRIIAVKTLLKRSDIRTDPMSAGKNNPGSDRNQRVRYAVCRNHPASDIDPDRSRNDCAVA